MFPGGGRGQIMPAFRNNPCAVSFGQKTLKGFGGHDMGYTRSLPLSITAGNGAGHWAISADPTDASYNRLVPAGVYGDPAPTYAGPYALTVSDGTNSCTVNITMVANAYSVCWRPNSVASADATVGTRNQMNTVFREAGLALGDTIYLRPGIYNYNDRSTTNWRVTKYMTTNRTGSWTGSNWITVRPDTDYAATLWDCYLEGDSVRNQFLHFTKVQFLGVGRGDGAETGGMFAGVNGASFVKLSYCRFTGEPRFTGDAEVLKAELFGGINGSSSGAGPTPAEAWHVEDNYFANVFRGVQLIGANNRVVGNTITNYYDDFLQFSGATNFVVNWNFGINHYAALTDTHGDSMQWEMGNLAAGTFTGGEVIGNIFVRGNGTPDTYDGQGYYFDGSDGQRDGTIATRYDNVVVKGNLYIGTMARGVSILCATDYDVGYNTILSDIQSNFPAYDPTRVIIGRSGASGLVQYTASTLSIAYEQGMTSGPETGNVTVGQTAATIATMFTNPKYGGNNVSKAQIIRDWAMKAGGPLDKNISGFTYNVGAIGTGYVDYDARTTSFPT